VQRVSENEERSVKTPAKSVGSQEQFDQYTSEIYDGLKVYASKETDSSNEQHQAAQGMTSQPDTSA